MKYSLPIRTLHASFAVGITAQLVLSAVMRQPRPGRIREAYEALAFTAHEYLGLALLAVLLAHWLLHLAGHAPKGLAHFFPWFSRERIARVAAEVKDVVRLKIGEPEAQDALAGAIQGLGLVIASLLAATGGVIWVGMADDGTMSRTLRSVKEVHETLGPLMWGYLGIHVAAAMAHVAIGHRSVLAIFGVRSG